MSRQTTFDCLLPNGLLLQATVPNASTFEDVKRAVWQEASKYPLFKVLKPMENYGFRCVNLDAEVQELTDDQLITSTDMFQPVLKMFVRKGSRAEQKQNIEIGSLIGKHLNDFESMRDPEVNAFRRDILRVCQQAVKERESKGASPREALALYRYPPNVEAHHLPAHLRAKIAERGYVVKVRVAGEQKEFLMKADIDAPPSTLVASVVKKLGYGRADDFVLQVVGRDECLLGDHKLGDYAYIRACLSKGHSMKDMSDIKTILQLESWDHLSERLRAPDPELTASLMKRTLDELSLPITDSLWFGRCAEQKFRIKILEAANVVTDKLFGIGVLAGIYLGNTLICELERTRYIPPTESPVWGQILEFNINIKDLPRDARLCFSVHGVWTNPSRFRKGKKNMRNEFPLAWVNVTVLDFRRCLRMGSLSLSTWQYPDTESDLMNVMGTTVPNPDRLSTPILSMYFEETARPVRFPESDLIGNKTDGVVPMDPKGQALLEIKQVEKVICSDPLHVISEKEVELLRRYRFYFKDRRQALSKCLRAVDWSRNEAAHEIADMLRLWTRLEPEEAIELLDAGFADASIRSYAVRCLESMGDDRLLAYLTQLVQVLKYESYLDCDLARFLLKRALNNQRIGHFFFWYLKAEMHLPEVSVRFGLLLEAYCRGSDVHMKELVAQNEAMRKLQRLGDAIKDKLIKDKKEFANEQLEKAKLGEFQLPLDPNVRLGGVTCRKVFGSAQKPMWLAFKNSAEGGQDVNVMFKAGDDLRQDMLTLQLIRIMDQHWQENGLNLQMTAYDCLSTGNDIGFLEMVMQSETIAGIQGGVKNVLFTDDALLKWLKSKNPSPENLQKACDNFLMSCAGYCVATYVLGVADRHNDNIMLAESGQLFHIDFGHFLANWKSKFGVRRERVKFVLVPEFVSAMTMDAGKDSERWHQFKDVCRQAYLVVRRKANLLINLLNMMLSTGIPELRSHEDVAYLRETLCLDMESESQAADHFMKEIDQALKDSKTVKVNWAFHSAKHG
eukprot:m.107159 g.107159  ORF g.107159 m.107159 type:complete len:1015 (-) comp15835_c0_seq1:121-3165(-)